MPVARSNWLLRPTPQATLEDLEAILTLKGLDRKEVSAMFRPVARSNRLLWPTPQTTDTL